MGGAIKNRPQELTKAELEIMQIIWKTEKVLVHDILAELPDPKPAYNTLSTIVRILENKGFVSHKAYGRTYEYFPIVGKEEYTNTYMRTVLDNFFEGSVSRMVNFFSSQKSISLEETDEILTHEASHVRHRHSYERLFMSVLRSIFWFNPFFWMAEKDLEEVQEWEADKDVLDEGWNLKTYRTTIF